MQETVVGVLFLAWCLVLAASMIAQLIRLIQAFRQQRPRARVVKVVLDDDLYASLQQLGDKNGIKDVSDVIPGICSYVCDGLRDQGVIDNA